MSSFESSVRTPPTFRPDGAEPHAFCPEASQVKGGYEDGVAAGRAEIAWADVESLRSARRACESAAQQLSAQRQSYLHTNRRAILELALAVSEKILRRTLASAPEDMIELVERVLTTSGETEAARVDLSAQDLATLGAAHAGELENIAHENIAKGRDVAFAADPELRPGDIRVHAGSVEVDARIEELLRLVRNELEPSLGVAEDTTEEVDATGEPA